MLAPFGGRKWSRSGCTAAAPASPCRYRDLRPVPAAARWCPAQKVRTSSAGSIPLAQNLERDRSRGRVFQVERDAYAGWRILARTRGVVSNSHWQTGVLAETNCGFRGKQMNANRSSECRIELTQQRLVVENPEAAAMRGCHQIAFLDHQVVHGNHRKADLKWLPVRSVVERNIDSGFRSGKKKARSRRDLRGSRA